MYKGDEVWSCEYHGLSPTSSGMNKPYNGLMKYKGSSFLGILHQSSKGTESLTGKLPKKKCSDKETKCKNFKLTYSPSVSSISP